MRNTVEGAPLDLLRGRADQPLAAIQHFLGRSASEGEQQDSTGRHPSVDEMSDSMDQGARFSGTGTGHYKEGRVAMTGRLRLRRVERGTERIRRWRGYFPMGGEVDPGEVGHSHEDNRGMFGVSSN